MIYMLKYIPPSDYPTNENNVKLKQRRYLYIPE